MIVVSAGTVILARPGVGIQFGIIPAQAVVLPLPRRVNAGSVLRAFEAARTPVTHANLNSRLMRCGMEAVVASNIIEELLRAGILHHSPTHQPITVLRTGHAAEALCEELSRLTIPAALRNRPRGTRDEVTVMTSGLFPTTDLHLELMEQRAIHLPAGIIGGRVTIGPLMYPGHTACFTCIDSHYEAEDAAWKAIRMQATAKPEAGDESSTAQLAHTLARVIHTHLVGWITDGCDPQAIPQWLGARVTVDPLEGVTRRQTFAPAPGCPSCALAALAQA